MAAHHHKVDGVIQSGSVARKPVWHASSLRLCEGNCLVLHPAFECWSSYTRLGYSTLAVERIST